MRVLHIDAGEALRGGQRQTLHLVDGLAEQGVKVRLLAVNGSPLFRQGEAHGIAVVPLSFISVWRESSWADVVHCHDSRAHTLAWLAVSGLKRRAPVVVSRRVAFPVKRTFLSGSKYGSVALYLSISEAVTRQLTEAGIPKERIALVPDGVNVPPYTGNRTGGIAALHSSDPGKGMALLNEIRPRVEFVQDLEKAFRTARIFLYATRMEGLGSAALLAMAHGVPVIASNVGGLPEIVHDGETGLLAKNTPQSFEAAISRLEKDSHLEERIIRNARAMVEQGYTVKHMVERTLACYRKLLG